MDEGRAEYYLPDALSFVGEEKTVDEVIEVVLKDEKYYQNSGGGALMDAGCYCANMIRWVMDGEPMHVQGYQRIHPSAQVDSTFTGLLQFPGGRIGYLATSMEAPFRVCCEIIGETGRIHTDSLFAKSTVTITTTGSPPRVETFEAPNVFQLQYEHFSTCILVGKQPRITREQSIGNASTLDALKQAANNH